MPEYRIFNPKNGDLLKKKFKTENSANVRLERMKKVSKYPHLENLIIKRWD